MDRKKQADFSSCQSTIIDKNELMQTMKENFLRQFISPFKVEKIMDHFHIQQFHNQSTIFEINEAVDRYYFLVLGKAILQKKGSNEQQKKEISLLESPCILGEYFYDSQTKRSGKAVTINEENPTVVVSIDRSIFHQLYSTQLQEYSQLKNAISIHFSVRGEVLEQERLFHHLAFQRYRYGEQILSSTLFNSIAIILSGECVLTSDRGVHLITGDYINLQKYFQQKQYLGKSQIPTKYRVASEKMQICIFTFEFISKLPEEFKDSLMFINDCHENAPISYNSLNSSGIASPTQTVNHIKKKTVALPQVRKKTYKKQDSAISIIRELQSKTANQDKKSRSIKEEKDHCQQQIQAFRKRYKLGYNGKSSIILTKPKKYHAKEPKGFFQIPTIKQKKLMESYQSLKDSRSAKNKDWSMYLLSKGAEKQNKNIPKAQSKKKMTPMEKRLEELFKRAKNQSLPKQSITKSFSKKYTQLIQFSQ